MMSLTNFLLLLILSIFTTYTFMSWKGIDKGPKLFIVIQFVGWMLLFVIVIYVSKIFGLISEF